jgi:uncharacterized repeat protein (TIGR03803 family)
MPVVATQFLRRSTRHLLTRCTLAFAILALSLIFATGALAADNPAAIWLFDVGNSHDGNNPFGAVISDEAGNLYGTTQKGGFPGFGVVFKLTPTSSGLWKETILTRLREARMGPTRIQLSSETAPAIFMARRFTAGARQKTVPRTVAVASFSN